MEKIRKEIIQEHPDIAASEIKKISRSFQKPDIRIDKDFKKQLSRRISEKIQDTTIQQEQTLDAQLPFSLKRRYGLTGFVTAFCAFLFMFILAFLGDLFSNQLPASYKYTTMDSSAFGTFGALSQESLVSGKIAPANAAVLFAETEENMDTFQEVPSYRYLFTLASFPKIGSELPVYKVDGSLLDTGSASRIASSLHLGDFSFKNIQNLELEELSFREEEGYRFSLRLSQGILSFYKDQISQSLDEESFTLPSERSLRKSLSTQLKSFGISFKDYGDPVFSSGYLPHLVSVFYPFLIDGYPVYTPNGSSIGVQLLYDGLQEEIISLYELDIAAYQVSSYPVKMSQNILDALVQGGDTYTQGKLHPYSVDILVGKPFLFYLQHFDQAEVYYLPAVGAEVNTSIENYSGPDFVYTLLV
ncbi:MAG: hypothetical protein PHU61_04170 [Candidatus Absconditabacteria bacterium]|nr:hypothetical protein [Candidatus Absconditabacteria bacterium]MDD3868692.1 hypothetical protein [Candidatus Absconditabacteria bacterium]MDD4714382.1 hypothetical protein [Candidatus Absconditabacteria bacterium]